MAYAQVGVYGMNPKVGLVSFPQEDNSFNKPFSNETAHLIDTEVRRMVQEAYLRTIDLLTDKKDLVTALAERLLAREVCTGLLACCQQFDWNGKDSSPSQLLAWAMAVSAKRLLLAGVWHTTACSLLNCPSSCFWQGGACSGSGPVTSWR